MGYRELMRKKLLDEIYYKLSPEEKLLFVQMAMQDKSNNEIMEALQRQQAQLEDIKKGQNWKIDFASDLFANFTSAGVLWLGSRLLKKL